MDALVNNFFADPMYYIGFAFAFVAAIAWLTLLRGFLTGSPHWFTISTHEGHLKHYRFRTVWGAMGLLGLSIAWETLRAVLAWVGVGQAPSDSIWVVWTGYIILGLILWVMFAVKNSVVNQH